MPRRAAYPNPREVSQINARLLQVLRNDPELWTIERVGKELDLTGSGTRRLWVRTRAYQDGSQMTWPPGLSGGKPGRPVSWWPPHHAALPAPDLPGPQPRWRAGRIRSWAMQTGRMDVTGAAIPHPTKGGSVRRQAVEVKAVEPSIIAQIVAFKTEDATWTTADIGSAMGVSPPLVDLWWRRTRNRLERGMCTWPPPRTERNLLHGPLRPATYWPPHPSVLPPPDDYREHATNGRFSPVWKKSTIADWALKTGRYQVVNGVLVTPNEEATA